MIAITALLAAALAASAPGASAAAAIQPALDSVAERQAVRDFTMCVAAERPAWARQTLARPYLSGGQAFESSQLLSGRDQCSPGPEVELQFRTSTVIAALAEQSLRSGLGKTDFQRVVRSISALEPLNVSEDFALCLASRNPMAARDLALSDPGTSAEQRAAAGLGRHIAACTNPGEDLIVDLQALRAMASIALYRGLTATRAAGS
jgi:hypothetical protein